MEKFEITRVVSQKQVTNSPENLFEQSESLDEEVFDLLVHSLMDNTSLVIFAQVCKKSKYEIPTEQKLGL